MPLKGFMIAAGGISIAFVLAGCGSDPSTPAPPPEIPSTPAPPPEISPTCGTHGDRTVAAVNDPNFDCYGCGDAPCVSSVASGVDCYSCYSKADDECYQYNCGFFCSNEPCTEGDHCGTTGDGKKPAVNDPAHNCDNCGAAPCVDSSGACYSCYSAETQECYAYDCGAVCSSSPCPATTTPNVTTAPSATTTTAPGSATTSTVAPSATTTTAAPSATTTTEAPSATTTTAAPSATTTTAAPSATTTTPAPSATTTTAAPTTNAALAPILA